MPPERVGLLGLFWSENGYTLCAFWSGIRKVFKGSMEAYGRGYHFNSK